MALTPEQVQLVKDSYSLICKHSEPYSILFYHQLFLKHPFVRALFPDELTHQTSVFKKTIDVLVENIADLARMRPTLATLARQHVQYGVDTYQYAIVGAVLIDTFAEILETRFTSEARKAWEALYAETAAIMISESSTGH